MKLTTIEKNISTVKEKVELLEKDKNKLSKQIERFVKNSNNDIEARYRLLTSTYAKDNILFVAVPPPGYKDTYAEHPKEVIDIFLDFLWSDFHSKMFRQQVPLNHPIELNYLLYRIEVAFKHANRTNKVTRMGEIIPFSEEERNKIIEYCCANSYNFIQYDYY